MAQLLTMRRCLAASLGFIAAGHLAHAVKAQNSYQSYSLERSSASRGGARAAYEERAAYMPPIWAGLYLGGNVGYSTGNTDVSGFTPGDIDLGGFGAGLHGGANWQAGNIVAGLEGDINWTGADGSRGVSGPASIAASNDMTSSLRLRLGYAYDNMLVYATGGAALGLFNIETTSGAARVSEKKSELGYVIGAGIAYKFSPAISAHVEALHYRFAEDDFKTLAGNSNVDSSMTTVRAGLTFHLR